MSRAGCSTLTVFDTPRRLRGRGNRCDVEYKTCASSLLSVWSKKKSQLFSEGKECLFVRFTFVVPPSPLKILTVAPSTVKVKFWVFWLLGCGLGFTPKHPKLMNYDLPHRHLRCDAADDDESLQVVLRGVGVLFFQNTSISSVVLWSPRNLG